MFLFLILIYNFTFIALIPIIIMICGSRKTSPGVVVAAQPKQSTAAPPVKVVAPVVTTERPVTQSPKATSPATEAVATLKKPTDTQVENKDSPKDDKQKIKRKRRNSDQRRPSINTPKNTKAHVLVKIDRSNKSNDKDDEPKLDEQKKDPKETKDAKEEEEDNDNKDVLHITNEDYMNEMNKALQRSKKGPEYEEMTYIKGPFSKYEKFKFKSKAKQLQKKDSNLSMIQLGSDKKSDKRQQREPRDATTFTRKAKLTKIPKDQMLPHRLRKDRQTRNAYRRTWVQNRIKEIGGYIFDDNMNPVYIAPSSKKNKVVEEAEY